MQDNKYYYDEQIKNYFYERHLHSFIKTKDKLENTELNTLLALLTKPALTDIAKRLDIRGYSKLGKDKLVELISDSQKSNISDILKELSYKELIFLKTLLKDDYNMYNFNIENLTQIGGLSALGLLYKVCINDSFYLIIPSDTKESIKKLSNNSSYMKELKSKSQATNYIDGIMNKYGMILAGDLYKLIVDPNSTVFNKDDLDFYIDYIFRSYEAFTEVNCLVHPYIFSPEDLYEELKVRQTIQYNFDDIDNLIALGENITSSFGSEISELKELLIKNKIKKADADLLITELIFYIKNDLGTQSIVDLVNERGLKVKKEDESDLITAIANVYNNTGIWTLKGLTPIELSSRRATIIKKDKEPGRNDPCPCNSGKKYKKCCGK